MKPRFFATPEKFRAWLAKNHATAAELLVGFHKKGCGKPSIDRPPSYRDKVLYWITSSRKPETRRSRLSRIMAASAAGKKL